MSDELKQEIDEFLAANDDEPVEPENENETETETSEESGEESPSVEAEAEETPETETETGTAADADAGEDEPEDELATLKKQNELLQQRLNEAYVQQPKTAEKPASDEPAVPEDFFGQWKFDDIVESQESLQKFLGEFAGKVVSVTKESVLKDLPSTVSSLTNQQMEARQVVDGFYGTHPQLATVKPFVAQVVSTVAAEHADWELPQVLEEAATRAYKSLGLKQQAKRNEKQKPAFAPTAQGGPRGRTSEPAKSKLEKELEELL